jgi:protein-disulfide isomerase
MILDPATLEAVRRGDPAAFRRLVEVFWEMHDLLLASDDGLARPALEGYAKVLGLDLERFRQDLDSHRFAARIAKDRQVADDFGIEGTPTFLFNGRIIRGARDVAFFCGLVDEELARR